MKSNHCTSTKKSYANSSQGSQKNTKLILALITSGGQPKKEA